MKIRAGYVSNSSSSSFCIVGIDFDENKFNGKDYETIENEVYDKKNGLKFTYGIAEYYDHYIIGLPITEMNEHHTLHEFKNIVFKKLQELGFTGSQEDIGIFIDGGYDG